MAKSPEIVMSKIERLHNKVAGATMPVKLVKYVLAARTDDFKAPTQQAPVELLLTPPPIVQSQPSKEYFNTVGRYLKSDERLFIIFSGSIIADGNREPWDTFENRVMDYILQRAEDRGYILYGATKYTIKAGEIRPTDPVGSVSPQILVVAAKSLK